jgi:osmotically-inducible protein OsmY
MKFFQKETDTAIRTGAMLLGGLGLGAALMYVLDPERGKRRRALVRDKAVRAAHKASDRIDARSRDLRNRARGAAAEVKAMTRPEDVPDAVLEERVRAEIGRVVSNPGAIEAAAIGGTVVLSGPVLASEIDGLLSTARGVRGVEDVENRLQVFENAEDIPSLQGARGPRGKAERGRERWGPAEAET